MYVRFFKTKEAYEAQLVFCKDKTKKRINKAASPVITLSGNHR